MTKTRVCVNPACEHHGAEQSIENFYPCGRDRKNRRRTCNDCVKKSNAARYIEERDDRHEYHVLRARRGGVIQREIAADLGVCPQRVHQIQGDAVRKIRKLYRTAE